MTQLAACPSCSRHVRIDESRCPFCSVGLEGAFANRPPPRVIVGRFSRAAIFALGTSAAAAGTILGCADDTTSVPIYGAPANVDAGAQDAADANTDSGSSSALYGAPPDQDSGGYAALYGLAPSGDR